MEMIFPKSLSWAVDGQGLFVEGWAPGDRVLLVHIDLQGRETLLLKSRNNLDSPCQSNDGKHVASGEAISHSNAWLIEHL